MIISTRYDKAFNRIQQRIPNFKNSQQSLGPDSLTGEFYETFREESTPILLNLFQKIAREGTLNSVRPESF